jgi:hypothetical protein
MYDNDASAVVWVEVLTCVSWSSSQVVKCVHCPRVVTFVVVVFGPSCFILRSSTSL